MRRASVALCAIALSSCGGGGGDGGAGNSLSVSADKSSVDIVGIVGVTVGRQTINFTASGGSGTYYGLVQIDRPGIGAEFTPTSKTSGAVTVTADSNNRTAGRLTGQLTFKLCTDSNCANVAWSTSIPYTLTMFTFDPNGVTINGFQGAATSATLPVTPPDTAGLLTLSARAVSGGMGAVTAAHDGAGAITVTASGAGVAQGSYHAEVDVNFVGSPVTPVALSLPVVFNVGNGIAAPPSRAIDVTATSTAASLAGSLAVAFNGTQSPAWTASSDQSWLVLSNTSGTGSGALSYSVDLAKIAGLPNWLPTVAHVTVSSKGLDSITTPVTLTKKLPEIYSISPYPVIAGRTGQATVAGRGLQQLGNGSSLSVAGVSGVTVTALSDTSATLTYPALAVGQYAVSASNASGMAAASAPLSVMALAPLGYATAANAGNKRRSIYDDVRSALYVSNTSQQTLVRYRLSGGTWQVDGLPIAGLGGIAFSPDHRTLYARSGNTRLVAVDPDTLQVRATYTVPAEFGFTVSCPCSSFASHGGGLLAVTNNNRLWLTDDWGGWVSLYYFDMQDTTFKKFPAPPSLPDGVFDNPGLYTPADGSMMLVLASQPDSIDKSWRYDSSTDALTAPAGLTYDGNVDGLSRDGGRFVSLLGEVYDMRTMALIGGVPKTGSYLFNVLSPDGLRLYSVLPTSDTSPIMDHIEVFDTTQVVPGTSTFVSLGQIPLTDQAGAACSPSTPPSDCNYFGSMTLNALGNTLFWVANARLVVIPIPSGMSGILAAPRVELRRAAVR